MKNYAITIINAIQTGRISSLKQCLAEIDKTLPSVGKAGVWCQIINQGLPQTNITPLHVACKGYDHLRRQDGQKSFEMMIALLLERGAEPGIQGKVNSQTFNAIEACGTSIPDCLRKWLSDSADNYEGYRFTNGTLTAMAQRCGHTYLCIRELSSGLSEHSLGAF